MNNPMVSVCMITYNHEKYIEQAIKSVIEQVADFGIEIIICDDFSTDNTLEILKKYQEKLIIIRNTENLGPWRSLEKTFVAAKGRFIALLEGDDYYTKTDKLQLQADFMESHDEYAMCFTNYSCVDENGQELDLPGFEYHKINLVSQKDIFNLICPPTRGVLFRKELLPEQFPSYHYETVSGDAFIFSMILKDNPAYFIDEKMAVWRIRNNSLYSSISDFERRVNIIHDFKRYSKYYTTLPQSALIKATLKKQYNLLLKEILRKPSFEKIRLFKSTMRN